MTRDRLRLGVVILLLVTLVIGFCNASQKARRHWLGSTPYSTSRALEEHPRAATSSV